MTRKALTLQEAASAVQHSHKGLGHGQQGNPFYPWWSDCKWVCDFCLALMRENGDDIALRFTNELPWGGILPYEGDWWKNAYLKTIAYASVDDHGWMREHLAEALERGRKTQKQRTRADG